MDMAHRIILGVIAGKVGLSISQVEEEAIKGTLGDRVLMCNGCRMQSCDRCQIAFRVTDKKTEQ